MKKALSYPELWKQKQRELPVKGNPDAEWLRMQALLDQRMPVTGTVKKPFRLKVPKWGLHILIGVSSVVAVYVGSRFYLSKKYPEPAKPGIQQIHRNSLAPAVDNTSPALNIPKPATGTVAPRITPVVRGADAHITGQTKLNSDSAPRRAQQIIDSIKAPALLNIPIHRDSLVLPREAFPLKKLRDSAGPADPGKRVIQKDTSGSAKKNQKKKKRSKVSIFF